MILSKIRQHYNTIAERKAYFQRLHDYYYTYLSGLINRHLTDQDHVMELGCGFGYLLGKLQAGRKTGIDISEELISRGTTAYPDIRFIHADAATTGFNDRPTAIVCSDLFGEVDDIIRTLQNIRSNCDGSYKLIITQYNYLWKPVLSLFELLRMRTPTLLHNYLPVDDLENVLYLSDFEVTEKQFHILFPVHIPVLSDLINSLAGRIPIIKKLCLVQFTVARPAPRQPYQERTCTVVIPSRNEQGNIAQCLERMPGFSKSLELIFVDGNSEDGTREEIERMIELYKGKIDIKLINQIPNNGKADAVWKGFDAARGEILMILDSDLTVPPEDLPKFYEVIASGKADFVNGSRLVYAMEKQAMRTLNYIANRIFGKLFSRMLGQRITDTLCGTKVLRKKDYERINGLKAKFGDFDPFGDFHLLFGAAFLKMKIIELPIVYHNRVWGDIKIKRFRHGLILIRMYLKVLRIFKFS